MVKKLLLLCAFFLSTLSATPVNAQSYSTWRYPPTSSNCSATTGIAQDLCKNTSTNTLYFCSQSTGCNGSGWVAVGGGVAWGGITGTLSNQTDLQTALNGKQLNLSLVAGTYTNGDMCTYSSSGTLLNCNTAIPSVPTSANPSATIGLAAVNGTASTFMTSDSAPALSQSIIPTWSGEHTFTASPTAALFNGGNVGVGSQPPTALFQVEGVGNVGIDSTNPGTALDVNGTVRTINLNVSGLTVSQIAATDASDNIQSLTTATYPSLTELSYVKGVTSAIQTQLNAKGSGTVTSVVVQSPLSGGTITTTGNVGIGTALGSISPVGNNVGIGSTNPGQLLDVDGTVRIVGAAPGLSVGTSTTTGYINAGTTGQFQVSSTGAVTTTSSAGYVDSSSSGQFAGTSSSAASNTTLQGGSSTTSYVIIQATSHANDSTDSIRFDLNNANEAMRLQDNSGVYNVGIGSTAPGQMLDVNGTVRAIGVTAGASGFTGAGTGLTGTAASLNIGGNAATATTAGTVTTAAQPSITSTGTLTSLLVSGNVGINSTAPGQNLDVQGTVRALGEVLTSNVPATTTNELYNNSGALYFNGSAVGGAASQWITTNSVGIGTYSNVGIGTLYPTNAALTIVGNVGIGTVVTDSYVSTTPPSGGMIVEGNVGIGTIRPGFPLQVNTNAFVLGTGGTITSYVSGGVTYKVHTFTSSSTFVAPYPATNVQLLVVAGGGGGGSNDAGGGGAGGVIYNSSYAMTAGQSVSVTVGAGGPDQNTGHTIGNNGSNSVFNDQTAVGGGGGNYDGAGVGAAGGSGGGGGANATPSQRLGGAGTAGQGNNGGAGGDNSSNASSGGGGGANQVGAAAVDNSNGGAGGNGISESITGTPTYYGGGGGGGGNLGSGGSGAATGGQGGGGAGGQNRADNCVSGTANTGGGGGGASNTIAHGCGGGSGIVIVAYAVPAAAQTIDTNGEMGINNNSASSALSITGFGSTSVTGDISVQNSSSTSLFTLNDSGAVYLKGNVGIGTISSMGALTVMSGNVGIGTWVPTSTVQIKGTCGTIGPVGTCWTSTGQLGYCSGAANVCTTCTAC